MGLQLIICVETNQKTKSDYIYIKNTIENFYYVNQSGIRLSPVFMDGKGNYDSRKTVKTIADFIRKYHAASKNNKSIVIYCFDCDNFDTNPTDKEFLDTVQKYCKDREYRFAWFCRDIEHVYLGKQIPDKEKGRAAERFAASHSIKEVELEKLLSNRMQNHRSNLCSVLDEFLRRKE